MSDLRHIHDLVLSSLKMEGIRLLLFIGHTKPQTHTQYIYIYIYIKLSYYGCVFITQSKIPKIRLYIIPIVPFLMSLLSEQNFK
jgi:hypothetical protein